MNGQPFIIAVIPDQLRHLQVPGVENPITILHTKIDCHRCARTCWIGPTQRSHATDQGSEVVCYFCIILDKSIVDRLEIIGLNDEADDLPRMFPND